jgi:hypothetical protein
MKNSITKLLVVQAFILLGLATSASAANITTQKPTQSVNDNSRAATLGIYANTEEGIALCHSQLTTGVALFYEPSDTHGFDASAKTKALEADTCARMRVRGGLIGVVALREGSLVNLGQRDGREQAVAYNKCNNWLELLPLTEPVIIKPIQTQNIVEVQPTTTEREVVDTVTVRRRTVVRYVDEVVYEPAPAQTIVVPATNYQYVERPAQAAAAQPPRCICYWPPDDPSVTQLYRFPYPDRAGKWWCVPLQMAQTNTPPPGFVR